MNKFLGLSVLVVTLGMAGCGETKEVVNDVDYYMTHEAERTSKLEFCKESAERKLTINCRNAHTAQDKSDISTMFGEGFPRAK